MRKNFLSRTITLRQLSKIIRDRQTLLMQLNAEECERGMYEPREWHERIRQCEELHTTWSAAWQRTERKKR